MQTSSWTKWAHPPWWNCREKPEHNIHATWWDVGTSRPTKCRLASPAMPKWEMSCGSNGMAPTMDCGCSTMPCSAKRMALGRCPLHAWGNARAQGSQRSGLSLTAVASRHTRFDGCHLLQGHLHVHVTQGSFHVSHTRFDRCGDTQEFRQDGLQCPGTQKNDAMRTSGKSRGAVPDNAPRQKRAVHARDDDSLR